MLPGFSGHMLMGTEEEAIVSSISFVTSAASAANGTSVKCPAGVQAGDILIFVSASTQGSGSPGTVVPAGFTLALGAGDGISTGRVTLSYKVADGSEGGATLNGQTTRPNGCIILVFRGDVPVKTMTPVDMTAKTAPVSTAISHTIATAAAVPPVLALGAGVAFGNRPLTLSPQTARVAVSTVVYAAYRIINASPTNTALAMPSSSPGLSAAIGGYFTFT